MSDADLDEVVDLILQRCKAIVPLLTPNLPHAAVHLIDFFVALFERKRLRAFLRERLE
jgi:hypothetical protein